MSKNANFIDLGEKYNKNNLLGDSLSKIYMLPDKPQDPEDMDKDDG